MSEIKFKFNDRVKVTNPSEYREYLKGAVGYITYVDNESKYVQAVFVTDNGFHQMTGINLDEIELANLTNE